MELVPATWATIAEAGRAIREGRRTCLDVLEACLGRIDACESAVRAWVVVDREAARERAIALDRELAADRGRGPLHGIPIGVKDIIDVAGLPTAAGFGPWAGRLARADAPIVARLRAAGAIIVGKTVTTQFAWIDPPATRNPWGLDRTPGGSSSGSAAAVACGMCLGALGSQTGGSITRPAAFCGVAGLKPTHGRLPVAGVLPLAPSLDHPGPIAATVGDLALLWQALDGAGDLAPTPIGPPRLGRLRGPFDDRADEVMRVALDRALAAWAAEGAVVTEPGLPSGFDDVLDHHRRVMAAEAAAIHEPILAEHPGAYLPRIRALVEEGLSIKAADYIRSRGRQEDLRQSILDRFDGIDALVTPAALGPAPDPSTTGDPAFNSPWSFTGLPTVSFPIGRSPEGLPMAVQFVGRPHAEAALLAVASWCESVPRATGAVRSLFL